MNGSARLALEGGTPVRRRPLPVAYDASGRLFGDEELAALADVMRSGTLARWGGTWADRLEAQWSAKLGVSHTVAVSSGSAAVHVALAALDLEPGSEVVTSPVTDMGTVIGILQNQLIPRFADVDPASGLITAETVERVLTERTRAIVAVHLFGQCRGVRELAALARRTGCSLVEDASQAHFSRLGEHFAGTFGDVACFSLQQSKVVSCGEGGLVCTSSGALAERARLYQNKGWIRGASGNRAYPFLGANLRISELQAAVAVCQLGKADEIVARRRASYAVVAERLGDDPAVALLRERDGEAFSWWALCFALAPDGSDRGPWVERALAAEGVPVTRGYIGDAPIYMTEMMQAKRTFGRSRLPWSLLAEPVEYRLEDCPGACAFLRDSYALNWNEGIGASDAADVAAAIAKVAHRLAAGELAAP